MTVEIFELGPGRLDETEPLWRALYDSQTDVAGQLKDRLRPFELAWADRRELEREWLHADGRSFVLAAFDDARIVGYAFVQVVEGTYAVSWRISDPHADLKALVVLPQYRGAGLGSRMMDTVEARLLDMGIEDLTIDVVNGNDDALWFYAERGAVPFTTTLVQRIRPLPPRPQPDRTG